MGERALFSAGGHQFLISYFGGDGNNVPEPGTLVLATFALVGLCCRRRRHRLA